MPTNRISVAMTTYNGERYLAEQLDSILAQTHLPCEIVVCDDCSKDGTVGILRRYERDYPGLVRVYENERNLGYVKNFEKAMNLCSGEYIACCDQDDVWLASKLERLLTSIGKSAMVHSDAILVDGEGKAIQTGFAALKGNTTPGFVDLLMTACVTGCTMMIKRSCFPGPFAFPPDIPHDYYLSIIASDVGIAFEPEPLVMYRQHGGNVLGYSKQEATVSSLVKNNPGAIRGFILRQDAFFSDKRKLVSDLAPYLAGKLSDKSAEEFAAFGDFVKSYSRKRIVDIDFFKKFKEYYGHVRSPSRLMKIRLALSWFNW